MKTNELETGLSVDWTKMCMYLGKTLPDTETSE